MGGPKVALLLGFGILGLIGCNSSGPPYAKWDSPQTPLPLQIAPGGVTVDLMGTTKPLLPFMSGAQQYWNFTLQLNTGVLNLDTWETFEKPDVAHYSTLATASGHIDNCKNPAVATSPNGQMMVRCEEQPGAKGKALENTFVVSDATTHNEIMRKQLDASRVIHGYAWSPNSQAVAVLSSSEEYNPKLWGMAEHWQRMMQYPLLTYYLTVYNVKTGEWREFTVRRDVPEKGWGRIVRWVE